MAFSLDGRLDASEIINGQMLIWQAGQAMP
jgi:hypothetical protein